MPTKIGKSSQAQLDALAKGRKKGHAMKKGGRTKGAVSIVGIIRQILAKDSNKLAKAVAQNLIQTAINQNDSKKLLAIVELINRVDGKVADKLDKNINKTYTEIKVTIDRVPRKEIGHFDSVLKRQKN